MTTQTPVFVSIEKLMAWREETIGELNRYKRDIPLLSAQHESAAIAAYNLRNDPWDENRILTESTEIWMRDYLAQSRMKFNQLECLVLAIDQLFRAAGIWKNAE